MCPAREVVLLFVMIISFSAAFLRAGRVCSSPALSYKHTTTTSRQCSTQFSSVDEHFMKLAVRHAQHAARDTEVPVGAVVVDKSGTVLAASRNRVEASHDATAHAEIVAMREAAQLQSSWRLSDCTVYSTLEPCPMCLAAMQSFRVKRLVYGAKDTRLGACGSFVNLAEAKHPFHSIEISGGLFAETSEGLLKRFFQGRRIENRSGEADCGLESRADLSEAMKEVQAGASQRKPALAS